MSSLDTPSWWMVDALDPRGGIAFASNRGFTLSDESHALREAPCVWIAPPAFQPEPVVSRMIGRAAERGCFQLGVFQDGEELTFATLEALTEFVRRIYLRSGGGDGLDGGGPPVPPIPPEPGPDLPPFPTEIETGEAPGRGPERAGPNFLALVRSFTEAGDDQDGSLIAGREFSWSASGLTPAQTSSPYPVAGQVDGAVALVARAAALVLHEMLTRFPWRDRPEEMDRWHTAARVLGCILDDVGIWQVLLKGSWHDTLAGWAKAFSAMTMRLPGFWSNHIMEMIHNRDDVIGFYLMVFGPFASDRYLWERFHYEYFDTYDTFVHHRRVDLDPIDALALVPLPRTLQKLVCQKPHEEATLTHLLCAVIGSPSILVESGSGDEDAAAVVLLAACWVVCQASDYPTLARNGASQLEAYRVDKLVDRAWEWLQESLPKLAFPKRIEGMIESASALRYAADGASAPVT